MAETVETGADLHDVEGRLEVKYGLPARVLFCNRGVVSKHRPSSAIEKAWEE